MVGIDMDKTYHYRLSEYHDAKIGLHYSVDIYAYGDEWVISKLFWHKEDAVAYLSQLTRSFEPV
jgi:hypothetical protein